MATGCFRGSVNLIIYYLPTLSESRCRCILTIEEKKKGRGGGDHELPGSMVTIPFSPQNLLLLAWS